MSASKFHAVRVRQPLRKPVAPPAGYTQAGGVSSALMVKSDLLASGGRVGGPAGAIQVIPNRFGRSAFVAYGDGTSSAPSVKEVGPGDSGEDVKQAAAALTAAIDGALTSPTAPYIDFDKSRPNYVAGTNEYKPGVVTQVAGDGKYTPDFSLQVGIFQKYQREKFGKDVDVNGIVDKKTWAILVPGASVTLKPKPASTGGGGGGAKTAVKGGGDMTPPATPLWQKPWFMPAAIGVGVLGVVGAIIFWPSKKAEQ